MLLATIVMNIGKFYALFTVILMVYKSFSYRMFINGKPNPVCPAGTTRKLHPGTARYSHAPIHSTLEDGRCGCGTLWRNFVIKWYGLVHGCAVSVNVIAEVSFCDARRPTLLRPTKPSMENSRSSVLQSTPDLRQQRCSHLQTACRSTTVNRL